MSFPTADERHELADRVVTAVKAAKIAVDAYLTSGGYASHLSTTALKVNDAGWPATVKSSWEPNRSSDPIDFRGLIGRKKNQFVKLDPDDIPELTAVIDYVNNHGEIFARISPFVRIADDALKQQYAETEAVDLVARTLSRYIALGIQDGDDEGIEGVYLELDRGKFDDELPVTILAPLLLTKLDLRGEFELTPDVSLIEITDSIQRARAPHLFSTGVPPYLQAAATHAIALKGRRLSNDVPGRGFLYPEISSEDYAIISRVCELIHLLSGRDTGYGELELVCNGWADRWDADLPATTSVDNGGKFPPSWDRGAWNTPGDPIDSSIVQELPEAIRRLSKAKRNVQLAARRAFQSTLRVDEDDAIIDACIGIEALLGNERDELTHRMAQRAATALRADSSSFDPVDVYRLVKQAYAQRSKIVHGGDTKQRTVQWREVQFTTSHIAMFLLRALLKNLLRREDPWTPESLDVELLEALGVPDRSGD